MLMQRSEKTQELIDYLSAIPVGETVGYQQIATDCTWDRGRQFHLLQSAIKSLAYDGIIFRSVRGIGYIRLDPDKGIYRVREWHGGQLKRSTGRMASKVEGTRAGQLSRDGHKAWLQAKDEVYVRRMYLEQMDKEDRKAEMEAKFREMERQRAQQQQEEALALIKRLEESTGYNLPT